MKNRLLFITSAAFVTILSLTSCQGGGNNPTSSTITSSTTTNGGSDTPKYSNENTPLIFSSQEVDGVFNPFFSTNAADSNIIGLTQIGMLGNDKDGNVTYGEDEAVVVLDYEQIVHGEASAAIEDKSTTYYFVLKNDIKFSDGSPLTMKDVLFNLYVYLDPVYNGSSTIYSTDIVGLKEYRTQSASENEQDRFNEQFQIEASQRINDLISASDDILTGATTSLTIDTFKKALKETVTESFNIHVVEDFEQACVFFRQELETDWTNSTDSYADVTFKSQNGTEYKDVFETNQEAFLYNEGYISFDRNANNGAGAINCALSNDYKEVRNWSKEDCINTVYDDKLPNDIAEILMYWATSTTLADHIVDTLKDAFYKELGDNKLYKNISGIKFANRTQPVTVNGKTYAAVNNNYQANGAVSGDNYEVLSIDINGIDPKAIWNFAFTVAPMYYYSDAEHIAAFDYETHFGVEQGSPKFRDDVLKNTAKMGVPVGAGPYVAAKYSGGTDGVVSGTFKYNNIIYFERNEHFLMGAPKIHKIRYQITPSNRMVDVLQTNQVDFVEPSATPETIRRIQGLAGQGIGQTSIETSGYGYIGINAREVPDLAVRQAIMHAIDIQETVNYYGGTADPIYRSMSRSNWAYPEEAELFYDYDVTGETSKRLVEDAGYTLGGDGIYQKNGEKLKYTFTIAGESNDHPGWQALYHASEILNNIGFSINVKNDSRALSKLAAGELTVWAAAWGSTIDPDMYQVYHKDSTATSVLSWGYPAIINNAGGRYDTEVAILDELSEFIEAGRETLDQSARKAIYSEALDLVMELAVELPTYQRDDLFAYNANKIDVSTFTPESERSSYNGLISRIWELSLNER